MESYEYQTWKPKPNPTSTRPNHQPIRPPSWRFSHCDENCIVQWRSPAESKPKAAETHHVDNFNNFRLKIIETVQTWSMWSMHIGDHDYNFIHQERAWERSIFNVFLIHHETMKCFEPLFSWRRMCKTSAWWFFDETKTSSCEIQWQATKQKQKQTKQKPRQAQVQTKKYCFSNDSFVDLKLQNHVICSDGFPVKKHLTHWWLETHVGIKTTDYKQKL